MSDSWETASGQEITFGGLHEAESVNKHFTIHFVAVDQEENARLIKLQQEICSRQFAGQGTFVPARGVSEAKRVVFRTY
jgi:cytochrome c-type biogenesis protein CcmE